MRRTPTAIISIALSGLFAGLAALLLLAAEDGLATTLAALGLAVDAGKVDLMAGKPALGGLCLGAALVTAMYATAGVSALLDAVGRKSQDEMMLEIATGGGLGILAACGLGAWVASADMIAATAFALAVVVVAARSIVRRPAPVASEIRIEPVPAPRSLAVEAARNANVVRFPMERAARDRWSAQ